MRLMPICVVHLFRHMRVVIIAVVMIVKMYLLVKIVVLMNDQNVLLSIH